jgi:hypothetical protein
MNELFIKSLYGSIVKENLQAYKCLFETNNVNSATDEYWRNAINLYKGLADEDKDTFMKVIKQTIVDTISNMLGVVDGSSTLEDFPAEPKLYLDTVDTEGELQDQFLAFIEEQADEI